MQFPRDAFVIDRAVVATLLDALRERGYAPVGPMIRDGAIVYDRLESDRDLPLGWTDEQEGGTYRLKRREDDALFGYVVGPHSWKKYLFPPATRLWEAKRTADGFEIEPKPAPSPRYALIGVRACELAAIAVQDRVFLGGEYVDPTYKARRDGVFVVAVNCGQAGNTCFCVSMETGPKAESGFDLALTELVGPERHEFLVEVASPGGREVLETLPHRPAAAGDVEDARGRVEQAAGQMGRRMDTTGIRELLRENHDHPRWDDVAARCLACANCTLVCPTCFCSTIRDVTDLAGDHAQRWRHWDSCFTDDFSYIHGGSVRVSAKSPPCTARSSTHAKVPWLPISSINNIALGLFFSSAITPFRRCSKSPRNLVPASIPPRSNAKISTSFSSLGMSPLCILWASPSAMAVLPTPGSPI